jgi:hypothetical protein
LTSRTSFAFNKVGLNLVETISNTMRSFPAIQKPDSTLESNFGLLRDYDFYSYFKQELSGDYPGDEADYEGAAFMTLNELSSIFKLRAASSRCEQHELPSCQAAHPR